MIQILMAMALVSDDEFLAFYSDGIKSFGVNDTIDDILAGGTFVY